MKGLMAPTVDRDNYTTVGQMHTRMQWVTVAPHLRACCNNSSFLCFSINCLSSADLEKRLPRISMLSGSGAAGSADPLGPGWSSEVVLAWEGARSAACGGDTAMTMMIQDTSVSFTLRFGFKGKAQLMGGRAPTQEGGLVDTLIYGFIYIFSKKCMSTN